MNKLLAAVAAVALALAPMACNKSPEGGTPGTKDSFSVKAPTMTTNIVQGDRQTVKLMLDRGSDFKKSVKLETQAPTGVKASLEQSTIKAGDSADVNLTVEAAKDAPVGDHEIVVTATPESGAATTVKVKVKVEAKKS